MSIKHIRKYYQSICNDYFEMVDTVHELEQAVSDNVVSPERLEQVQKSLEIIKTNYMRWSYMMYLLDMPNKKEKEPAYKQRMKKALDKIPKKDRVEGTKEENKKAINQFKEDIKSLNCKQ